MVAWVLAFARLAGGFVTHFFWFGDAEELEDFDIFGYLVREVCGHVRFWFEDENVV
jgi:hypothetical protein